MENVTTDTARKDFQATLLRALEIDHPQWEQGYKGKGRGYRRAKFKTIAHETLLDWVANEKGICPQEQPFERFLEEGQFPEDTVEILWTAYTAFKRERKRGKQPLQRDTSQAAHPYTNHEDRYGTIPINTSTLQKEYMNENDAHKVDWLAGSDRELVELAIFGLGQEVIHRAIRSMVKNFPPNECADIILSAFRKIVDDPRTWEGIITWVELHNQSSDEPVE